MEYRKPTVSVLAKAINAIEGSNSAAKANPLLDGPLNPNSDTGLRNASSSAYEADE